MPCIKIKNGYLCSAGQYKAGDMPPQGYLKWHEWAKVQYKSGLRQSKCTHCGCFLFPQEIKAHKCLVAERE